MNIPNIRWGMTNEPKMTSITSVSFLLSLTKTLDEECQNLQLSCFMRITSWHFGRAYALLWEHLQFVFSSPLFELFFCYLSFLLFQMVNPLGVRWSLKFFLVEGKERVVVSINSNKTFHMIDINVFDFAHAFGKGLSCQSPLSTLCSHLPSIFREGEPSLQYFWRCDGNELELSFAETCVAIRGRRGEAVGVQLTQLVSRAQRPSDPQFVCS